MITASEKRTPYPRGAEWRKWDLHVHSDASDGKSSPAEIVGAAKKSGISVIALTDHHTARNVDNIRSSADKTSVSVIAGIEFRTEYGSKSVHLIGLFPEYFEDYHLDSAGLQSLVLDALDLSEARIIAAGRKSLAELGKKQCSEQEAWKTGLYCVEVDFRKAAAKIHAYGGVTIPHAGSKENSIDREMKHEGKPGVGLFESLGPVKQKLFEEGFIDFCEIRSKGDNERFYMEKFNRASIVSSDAHTAADVGRAYTWIKADPTFPGLLQVMQEPAARTCLDDEPAVLRRLKLSPTKYIEKLHVTSVEGYDGQRGKWFENTEIPLNPELVAIIGNKGSGKSAVADILGLCTDCRKEDRFSFLKGDRFRQKGYADKFLATVDWHSGNSSSEKILMSHCDHSCPETSKYLPQGYFEVLCNETEGLKALKGEINEVVYGYVPDELKADHPTFESYLQTRSSATSEAINSCKRKLVKLNRELIRLEAMKNPRYQATAENALSQKEHELSALKPPMPVEKPPARRKEAVKESKVEAELVGLKKTISSLERQVKVAQTERGRVSRAIEAATWLKKEATRIDNELSEIVAEARRKFRDAPAFDLRDVIALHFKKAAVDSYLAVSRTRRQELDAQLADEPTPDAKGGERSLVVLLGAAESKRKVLNDRLDLPNLKYQKYLSDKKAWKDKRADIIGDAKTEGTLKYCKKAIAYLGKSLELDIGRLRRERDDILREIHRHKKETIALYSEVKDHVAKVLKEHSKEIKEYPIEVVAELHMNEEFVSRVLSFVTKTVSGSYKGIVDGRKVLEEMCHRYNVNEEDDVVQLLSAAISGFEMDLQAGVGITRYIDDQVPDLEGLYEYLYGLDYISEDYQLRMGGRPLEMLSPGEKGAVLLVFYLLLDRTDIPLILDQPEDNLDNQSIFQILVPFIRMAKNRRQIIMVTHNPNLAVVTDAEQVIRADLQKSADNEFAYAAGGIENESIKKAIVDVLEGTMPAFANRSHKYSQRT